jgi:hypothetical protein
MIYGQMAAPVGRGANELSTFVGVQYATQTNPPFNSTDIGGEKFSNQNNVKAFALPGSEANFQHGFDDHVALNVHLSQAGIQPGIKWTLNKSRVAHVALLPAVAFGYGSQGSSTLTSGMNGIQVENNPSVTTSFQFLAGLKFLVSHNSGFYAGIGYDFSLNRSVTVSLVGQQQTQDRSDILTVLTSHQLSAAVGFDIAIGMLHLRPEVAFAVNPIFNVETTNRSPGAASAMDPSRSAGGFAFAIFPGFSLSIATPKKSTAQTDEEGDQAEQMSGDSAEDEDAKPKAKRKYKKTDDDEDEVPAPSKKRAPLDEDEESN